MQWIRRIVQGRSKAEQWMCERIATRFPNLGVCGPAYSRTRVIPVHTGALLKNKIILDEDNQVAEQFKMLRTLLFNRTRSKGWSTIQITGFGAGEGKSLIA